MTSIIPVSGETPRTEIAIQTRKGTPISNVQENTLTGWYLHQIEEVNKEYKQRRVIFVNNASPIYNCHGLIFGSKRSSISEVKQVATILQEDDYLEIKDINNVKVGDIVVYYADDGDAEHSGLVVSIESNTPWILSKWGLGREAVHRTFDCPYNGMTLRYYRISK